MDGYSEYSVARFKRCKYFSQKLIDYTGEQECLEKIPTFYEEVISTWERICIGTSCDLEFILSQSLWDNHFVIKVKPFLINDWNLKVFLWL